MTTDISIVLPAHAGRDTGPSARGLEPVIARPLRPSALERTNPNDHDP